jgi:hypothetical protein
MFRAKKTYDFFTLGRGKWYLTVAWVVAWPLTKFMSILGVSWCRVLWDFDPYRLLGIVLCGVVIVTLLVAYLQGA